MNRIYLKGLSILFIGILIIASCTDEPLKVGLEILPDNDLLNANADSLSIKCLTVNYPYAGYSSSTNDETDNCPIGHVIDPVFGQTWAQIIMQIDKGDSYYSYDSVNPDDEYEDCYLYLNITSSKIYGDPSGFDVLAYPLKQTMNYGSTAGSPRTNYKIKSDEYPFYDLPLSETTDFVLIESNELIAPLDSGNYIRIKLDDEFGRQFMDAGLIDFDSIYYSTTNFLNQFPGFYLDALAKTTTGGLNNFFYTKSKLLVKYIRPDASSNNTDTTIYASYDINAYQGFYRHNINNSPVFDAIGDTIESEDFYVQSLDGVKGYIELSDLEAFKAEKGGKVGVNLAELVLPVNSAYIDDTINFFYPQRITIQTVLDDGNSDIILDDFFADAAYFNGYFNSEKLEYRVNISEFVHQYLEGNSEFNSLYVMGAVYDFLENSQVEFKTPGRIVLNTGIENTNPAYLRLIYTLTDN